MTVHANGRDIFSSASIEQVEVLDQVDLMVELAKDKRVLSCQDRQGHLDLSPLLNLKVGREVRAASSQIIPPGSLANRILEELPPLAFLGRGAQMSWLGGSSASAKRRENEALLRSVEGLCISYQDGSEAMTHDGKSNIDLINQPSGVPATQCDDPWGWHDWDAVSGPHLQRLRRQDVWFDGELIHVDMAFQDAAKATPDPHAYAIYHEYRILAAIEPGSMVLREIETTPGTLPYVTCLSARPLLASLLGMPVTEFARSVPEMLGGIGGCTHLNSALQTMADIAWLERLLPASSHLH